MALTFQAWKNRKNLSWEEETFLACSQLCQQQVQAGAEAVHDPHQVDHLFRTVVEDQTSLAGTSKKKNRKLLHKVLLQQVVSSVTLT